MTLNVRHLTPQFYVSTYPDAWIREYTSARYVLLDPITQWSLFNNGVTRWSAIKEPFSTLTGRRVFAKGRAHGLNFGAACVLRNKKSNDQKCAIYTARGDREHTDAELEKLHEVLVNVMDDIGPFAGLSESELETLRDIAMGMTHGAIADARGISTATVKKRIERARQVLGAQNATHAVAIATKRGLILQSPIF